MPQGELTGGARTFIINALTREGVSKERAAEMVAEFESTGRDTEVGHEVSRVIASATWSLGARLAQGYGEVLMTATATMRRAAENMRPALDRLAEHYTWLETPEGQAAMAEHEHRLAELNAPVCGCVCGITHPRSSGDGGCVVSLVGGVHPRVFAVEGYRDVTVPLCEPCACALDAHRAAHEKAPQ